MSAIYNLEPQPTASAIIHTSQGEVSVELFAKQTPLTCRNFLQLALDGYYDNTIFHRLVPGFILQGGDPTGSGNGGESIYDGGAFSGDLDPWPMDQRKGDNAGPAGVCFKDEIHSRLKFNRRGLLGMANEGKPDSNGSQFFFTLDKTDSLTGRNTLFGRVAGDTIYNLAKMGEAELADGTERPLFPAKVTRVEILVNPFGDMRKRLRLAQRAELPVVEKKKKRTKGGKQLLSFADDEEAVEVPLAKKPKFDTRIVMDGESEVISKPKAGGGRARTKDSFNREHVPQRKPVPPETMPTPPSPKRRKKEEAAPQLESRSRESEEGQRKSLLERTNDEIAALKASMKRTVHLEPVPQKEKTALERMIPETSARGRKRKPADGKNDQKTAAFLESFRTKLGQAQSAKNMSNHNSNGAPQKKDQDDENGEEEVCDLHFIANCRSCKAWDTYEARDDGDDDGWMSHSLSCAADKLGKDLSYRKKAEEELVVIDPREKARTLQEEKRAGRKIQGGASRPWDQVRSAQTPEALASMGRKAR